MVDLPPVDHLYRLVHWLRLYRVARSFLWLRAAHLLRGDPRN